MSLQVALTCQSIGFHLHTFSSPNWYTAIVLNQLFLSQLPPSAQQSAIFNKLLPFLEASVQGTRYNSSHVQLVPVLCAAAVWSC